MDYKTWKNKQGRGGNPRLSNYKKPLSPLEPAGQWEKAVLTEVIRGSNDPSKMVWQEQRRECSEQDEVIEEKQPPPEMLPKAERVGRRNILASPSLLPSNFLALPLAELSQKPVIEIWVVYRSSPA